MNHFIGMNNFYFRKDAVQVLDWAIDNDFSGVEIWADVPYLYVRDVSEDILRKFQKAGKKIEYTVHSPIYGINISSVNPGILRESISQIKMIMNWVNYFPVRSLIIHAGETPAKTDEVMDEVRKITFNSINELIKEAESKKIKLLIENIGISRLDIDEDIEEFKSILRKFELGMCLDTGHANIKWGGERTVKDLGDYVEQIHVADNFGEYDQHLPAGEGNINWMVYKDLICKSGIPVVHEIVFPDNPEEATLKSRDNLERIFKNCFT